MDRRERDQLIWEHKWIAEYLVNRLRARGLGRDIWQEAMLGLLMAAERYDKKRGKFVKYAFPYVHGHVMNAINKTMTGHICKIPYERLWYYVQVNNCRTIFEREGPEQLADFDHRLRTTMPRNVFIGWLTYKAMKEELDEHQHEGRHEGRACDVLEAILNEELREATRTALDELEGKHKAQAQVLRMRYGIGYAEMSLQAISEKLGCTRQNVHIHQGKAEKAMRPLLIKHLSKVYGDWWCGTDPQKGGADDRRTASRAHHRRTQGVNKGTGKQRRHIHTARKDGADEGTTRNLRSKRERAV